MPATSTAAKPRQRRSTTPAAVLANARSAAQGVKVGRPLSYSPELCERAVALGIQGKHQAAIARAFNVDKSTLIKWARDYEEFSIALSRARTYSQAWWEDDVQRNRKAKHYQANAVRMIVAGQFKEDYAERPATISGELVDFLTAVVDAAGERQTKKIAPGDAAKPIEAQDVVLVGPNKARSGTDKG
jgi:hypothetical protein